MARFTKAPVGPVEEVWLSDWFEDEWVVIPLYMDMGAPAECIVKDEDGERRTVVAYPCWALVDGRRDDRSRAKYREKEDYFPDKGAALRDALEKYPEKVKEVTERYERKIKRMREMLANIEAGVSKYG